MSVSMIAHPPRPVIAPRRGHRFFLPAFIFLIAMAASLPDWRGADYAIMHVLNRWANRWLLVDRAFEALTADMLSNVPMIALACYAWFKRRQIEERAGLLIGLIGAFASGVLSRALQLLLPTHHRPLHDPALQFHAPFGVDAGALNHWSSFPSDHSAVFFGVATAIWLTDRKAGRIAIAYGVLINLVRIYCGYHFPSDVVGGAMLGTMAVMLAYAYRTRPAVLMIAAVPPESEPLFYGIAFYVLFGVATLWDDWRHVVGGIWRYVRHLG